MEQYQNKRILNRVIGKIEDVSLLKEGETEGRAWKLYKVTINGKTFTTFDAGFKELIGKEKEWEYEEKEMAKKSGEVYTRRTLKFSEQKEIEKIIEKEPCKEENETTKALREIWKKLDEVGIKTEKLNKTLERFESEDRIVFYPPKKEDNEEI